MAEEKGKDRGSCDGGEDTGTCTSSVYMCACCVFPVCPYMASCETTGISQCVPLPPPDLLCAVWPAPPQLHRAVPWCMGLNRMGMDCVYIL